MNGASVKKIIIIIKNKTNLLNIMDIKVPDMEWETTGRNVGPQTRTLNSLISSRASLWHCGLYSLFFFNLSYRESIRGDIISDLLQGKSKLELRKLSGEHWDLNPHSLTSVKATQNHS